MGSCASVDKKDPGFPRKQFLASPTKAKAAIGKGGGVAPVGDGFGGLNSKAEAEQQLGGFGPNSPDSGTRDESLVSLFFFSSEVPIFIFLISYYSLKKIFGGKESDGQSVLYMKRDFLGSFTYLLFIGLWKI